MKKVLAMLGGATVALSVLFATTHADADVRHRCDMSGTWVESGEHWLFSADYVLVDNGSDWFSGIFANPAAGASANVHGAANGGTWNIKFTYTDADHIGWVRHLVGPGVFNRGSHTITVSGTETLKKSGVKAGGGTFTMTGKCHAV